MPLKKIIPILIFSLFFMNNVNAEIKIEKRFKMWESQYSGKGKDKICFAVSIPTKMSPANLNRAESRIFVTFRPNDGVSNEISVTNGYEFQQKAPVTAKSGKKVYDLFSKGRFAWVVDNEDEVKLIFLNTIFQWLRFVYFILI